LKSPTPLRDWYSFFLGKLLAISGVEIPKTQLNEPWNDDDEEEDIALAEIQRMFSKLFGAKLGEPRSLERWK
jgi:hypothetical protein